MLAGVTTSHATSYIINTAYRYPELRIPSTLLVESTD